MGKKSNKRGRLSTGSDSAQDSFNQNTTQDDTTQQRMTQFLNKPSDTSVSMENNIRVEDSNAPNPVLTDVMRRIESLENTVRAASDRTRNELLMEMERLQGAMHDVLIENKKLKEDIKKFHMENTVLEQKIMMISHSLSEERARGNDLEQWTRRSSVRIIGTPDSRKNESHIQSEEIALEIFRKKLGLQHFDSSVIDIAHRIGKFEPGRRRQILVKFRSRKDKLEVILHRRKLKGSGTVIVEDLTAVNAKLFDQVRKMDAVSQAWTSEGRILAKGRNNIIIPVTIRDDLAVINKKMMSIQAQSNYTSTPNVQRSARRNGGNPRPQTPPAQRDQRSANVGVTPVTSIQTRLTEIAHGSKECIDGNTARADDDPNVSTDTLEPDGKHRVQPS